MLSCEKAQAANQLLLSPYRTTAVWLSMPLFPSSSSSFFIGTISRTSVSQRSVVQFQPMAPGTWPWSYAAVSTSTSTTRTPVSLACCATQSVFTSTFGTGVLGMFVLNHETDHLFKARDHVMESVGLQVDWGQEKRGACPAANQSTTTNRSSVESTPRRRQ